ncbi:MAG: hypothetical protein M1828_006038 [Chrysothrix sp. TS-e1954]|nr:MAG: hypothetical protein M1828_006038 [Chrysothrix sp. TS-e1954]
MPGRSKDGRSAPKQCPLEDCSFTYSTAVELRDHVQNDAEHEYCSTCDEAFGDWEDFKRHKVLSMAHISCPTCGIDFKSASGLRLHMETRHKAQQRLICPGCNVVFSRVGLIVDHFAKGSCRNAQEPSKAIKTSEFKDHITHKAIVHCYLHPEHDSNSNAMLFNCPTDHDGDSTSATSNTQITNLMDDESVSAETEAVSRSTSSSTNAIEESLRSVLLDDGDSFSSDGRWGSHTPSSTLEPETMQAGNMFNRRFWSAHDRSFNPENHFNALIERYECPMPGCRFMTQSPNDLFLHCLKRHAPGQFRCVSCLRTFKDFTALMQHMESATARCKINKSANFAFLMHQITGGFVEVSHKDEFGRMLYSAHRPEEFEDL